MRTSKYSFEVLVGAGVSLLAVGACGGVESGVLWGHTHGQKSSESAFLLVICDAGPKGNKASVGVPRCAYGDIGDECSVGLCGLFRFVKQ
ncbi:hypothetical protein CFELI_02410 [Corynebacterium felinum]|uniref:Secreted protein n=1 Tax=Corynebacterium felinum TaxID=131318 RepID=A0ABU2B825_9CORY|nr:hypothetical protein [Corynebacterium felinum]WJY94124.1 hypothetical protein CFELI_02410 [Corynebacterium felinum]